MSRYVAMGVSGCGKSLIGNAFAEAVGAIFVDGDGLHPPANIAKMSRGEPLNDIDRAPWLDKVGEALAAGGTVVACSALKRRYRDQIRAVAGAPVTFLFLRGKRETLLHRMASRPGHFMPPSLLDSQLATLEPPAEDERYLVADIEQTPAAIVACFQAGIRENAE
jgi:gluconokinase